MKPKNFEDHYTQEVSSILGTWIAIGVGLGVPLGLAFGNLALGIAIGCALGTAIGATKARSSMGQDEPLNQYAQRKDIILLIGGGLVLFGLLTLVLVSLLLPLFLS